jgi:predicted DNA-binding protein
MALDFTDGAKTGKIEGTVENWENGTLGCSAEHARVAPPGTDEMVDEILGIQMVSFRVSKKVVEEFDKASKLSGVIPKALMRKALEHYIENFPFNDYSKKESINETL